MSGSSKLQRTVNAPRQYVWDQLNDFSKIGVLLPQAIERVECNTSGIGAIRHVFLKEESGYPGEVIERYDGLVEGRAHIYSVLGECCLPFVDYVACVNLDDTDDGQTALTWNSNWNEIDMPAEELSGLLEGLYSLICDNIEEQYKKQ